MTIPHIAVISGLLLAGNNPNTLEGITGRETIDSAPLKWKVSRSWSISICFSLSVLAADTHITA